MTGRWLVRLYPRAWRERYGAEMSAMLEQMPLTPAAVIDLVAGAIDARVAPHVVASRPISSSEKEKAMLTNMMKRCAAGPALSVRDQWIGAWVMLGSCLLFSVAYVWGGVSLPRQRPGRRLRNHGFSGRAPDLDAVHLRERAFADHPGDHRRRVARHPRRDLLPDHTDLIVTGN
jgi:hypothetical protein